MIQLENDSIRNEVREEYGKIAEGYFAGCGCSVTSCCGDASSDVKTSSMALGYSNKDVNEVPDGANMGLGCGNPQTIAELRIGETVLDLGSGGGFDCFLAAKQVGQSGHVIGVDMTPAMLSKARYNADKAHYENVEFRLGEIENLPVADASVDIIMSNCVINLSPEKSKVYQEAFRALKPGGRLAISDMIATVELPKELRNDMALFTACVSGASSMTAIESMLQEAGFENIEIEPKDRSKAFVREWLPDSKIEDYIVSATIKAIKPQV